MTRWAELLTFLFLCCYWQVGKEVSDDPYTEKTCKLFPEWAPADDKDSTFFWMEFIVHIVFPDAISNLLVLIVMVKPPNYANIFIL